MHVCLEATAYPDGVIRDQLADAIRGALNALGVDPIPDEISLERPAQREHGDWSSNVALATAKNAGRNPRELGTELVEYLNANKPASVESVEVAGPGFVNFRLDESASHELLRTAVAEGVDGFARHQVGNGERVIVEFISANPTGPLHAGHARNAVVGDTVARLLQRVGHPVEREFYINDRGVQMETFAASLTARKAGIDPAEDGYQGQYIKDWAAEMPDDADPLEWGYAHAKADQVATLARMGIVFDTWFSERSMVDTGVIEAALAVLAERDMTYEQDGATWLKSTEFGDDKDRVLIKGDGSYTYLTPDIAYHADKFDRADRLIDVLGADHHGYVPRMRAAMQALGKDPAKYEAIIMQLVRLEQDGREVKISKRTGDIIELAEIIDEIGPDATRFLYSIQSVDSKQTFDLDLAASQGMDNPVYYVQMAHARLCGVQSNAIDAGVPMPDVSLVDLSPLGHEREQELLRKLGELPDVVLLAANDRAPHKVTTWLRDYAGAVHGFYHDCYVVGDGISDELSQARLALCEAAKTGLRVGLDLLGVSAPERM